LTNLFSFRLELILQVHGEARIQYLDLLFKFTLEFSIQSGFSLLVISVLQQINDLKIAAWLNFILGEEALLEDLVSSDKDSFGMPFIASHVANVI
jgi:hypothetical protein